MKKLLCAVALTLVATLCFTACNSNKFKKTDSGLRYRFEVTNEEGEKPQVGDVLVGELTLKLDTALLYTNAGHPDRLIQVASEGRFSGDIQEGLLMMHKGDKAVFAIDADKIAQYITPMPEAYYAGAGQTLYYEISLSDIKRSDEIPQEKAEFLEEMAQMKGAEADVLAQYIADNNITAQPTASGLYIIVKKIGNGPTVGKGKTVSIDYTGRLLDGTIFDSSRETDAKEGGKYVEGRKYEPMEYKVGAQPLIAGWDEGVMNQPEGTELTLIMPSKIAYGARGAGRDIPSYSPLRFDITIVSVK